MRSDELSNLVYNWRSRFFECCEECVRWVNNSSCLCGSCGGVFCLTIKCLQRSSLVEGLVFGFQWFLLGIASCIYRLREELITPRGFCSASHYQRPPTKGTASSPVQTCRSSRSKDKMAATRTNTMTNLHILAAMFAAVLTICTADDVACSSSTLEALQDFRSAFTDPSNAVFSSWDSTTDCCTWKGVTCQDGAVTVLDVEGPSATTSNKLLPNQGNSSGKPGHTLSKLKSLQTLKLMNLPFGSRIPSQWGSFSDTLQVIVVNNCDLQEEIPSGIASNSKLQTLDLKGNSLKGDIPGKLCNLKELKYLDVSYNELDVTDVPDCIANGGSVTNVNYGHQSGSTSDSGSNGGDGDDGNDSNSGSGGNGGNSTTYSPYSGATGKLSVSLFQFKAGLLLLVPILTSIWVGFFA